MSEDTKQHYHPVDEAIIDELKEMGFSIVNEDRISLIFVCKNDKLLVRVLPGLVDIACLESFDRWANSVDFTIETESFFDSKHKWSIKRPIEIATKIVESGIVDFNKWELKAKLSLDFKKVS